MQNLRQTLQNLHAILGNFAHLRIVSVYSVMSVSLIAITRISLVKLSSNYLFEYFTTVFGEK